jgi:hypothetical protein
MFRRLRSFPVESLVAMLFALTLLACGNRSTSEGRTLAATGDSSPFVPRWELVHAAPTIDAAALNQNGTEGWAFTALGSILHFQNRRWAPIKSMISNDTDAQPANVALSADGTIAWALGTSALEWKDRRWQSDMTPPSAIHRNFLALRLRDDGREGWALSDTLSPWHLSNEHWEQLGGSRFPFAISTTAVDISPSGRIWAIGTPKTGAVGKRLPLTLLSMVDGKLQPTAAPLPTSIDEAAKSGPRADPGSPTSMEEPGPPIPSL